MEEGLQAHGPDLELCVNLKDATLGREEGSRSRAACLVLISNEAPHHSKAFKRLSGVSALGLLPGNDFGDKL